MHLGDDAVLADIRKGWDQALIVNRPGRALQDVGSDIAAALADVESYGRFVLSTPDFTARLKSGAPMNEPDKSTYYAGGANGYTDRLPDAGREGGGVMQPIKLERGTKRGDRQGEFVIEILHPIRTGVEPCGLPTR
jgi:hypothetical protein